MIHIMQKQPKMHNMDHRQSSAGHFEGCVIG